MTHSFLDDATKSGAWPYLAIFVGALAIRVLYLVEWSDTTEDRHKRGVQKLWRRVQAAGDLYKDEYEGKYCVSCENFLTGLQLVDGKCPDCGRPASCRLSLIPSIDLATPGSNSSEPLTFRSARSSVIVTVLGSVHKTLVLP